MGFSYYLTLHAFVISIIFFIDIIRKRFKSKKDKNISTTLSSLIFFNSFFGSEAIRNSIYFPRNIEYPLVINKLNIYKGQSVLDIGTGTFGVPLVPFYLAKHGAIVYCLDFDKNFKLLEEYAYKYGFGDYVKKKKLNIKIGDTRNLPFPDNFFDRVSAISSIEHIPYDGDIQAIREIMRVLKPDGKAVITVDCLGSYLEEWQKVSFYPGYEYEERILNQKSAIKNEEEKAYTFFIRFYDRKNLFERLVNPLELELIEAGFYGERFNIRHYFNPGVNKFIGKFFSCTQPLIALSFYRKIKESDNLKKFFGIVGYIILRKK